MAVAEQERTDSQQNGEEGQGHGAALKAAGAAAATGAAAFAVQKMLSQRGKSDSEPKQKERQEGGGQGSVFASAAAGGWDAARDALVPLAESAAGAAGKYLAEHGPDLVRDRVVPRFIDAFNDAK